MKLLHQFTLPCGITFNFYLLDILIKFNTGCYIEGTLVFDRRTICKEYLRC